MSRRHLQLAVMRRTVNRLSRRSDGSDQAWIGEASSLTYLHLQKPAYWRSIFIVCGSEPCAVSFSNSADCYWLIMDCDCAVSRLLSLPMASCCEWPLASVGSATAHLDASPVEGHVSPKRYSEQETKLRRGVCTCGVQAALSRSLHYPYPFGLHGFSR